MVRLLPWSLPIDLSPDTELEATLTNTDGASRQKSRADGIPSKSRALGVEFQVRVSSPWPGQHATSTAAFPHAQTMLRQDHSSVKASLTVGGHFIPGSERPAAPKY